MSILWDTTEFRTLLDARDLAAYRAVAAIQTIVDFFEAQDYASALAALKKARAEFDEIDRRINQFRKSHKGDLARHGHRTARI